MARDELCRFLADQLGQLSEEELWKLLQVMTSRARARSFSTVIDCHPRR
jgi:hypothetical protein